MPHGSCPSLLHPYGPCGQPQIIEVPPVPCFPLESGALSAIGGRRLTSLVVEPVSMSNLITHGCHRRSRHARWLSVEWSRRFLDPTS
jgi:hypothetical protein